MNTASSFSSGPGTYNLQESYQGKCKTEISVNIGDEAWVLLGPVLNIYINVAIINPIKIHVW